jgi:predicted nucleic acid-binding protein
VIVVSDTSPLNYLILIGAVDALPQLFKDVHVPPIVLTELLHPRAPERVRQWVKSPPDWLLVKAPSSTPEAVSWLDPGEAEAIALAMELNAEAVLIDERKGRLIAEKQGIAAVGTLTILELAAERGLLELRPVLETLRQTSFYITEEFIEAALQRDAARRSGH